MQTEKTAISVEELAERLGIGRTLAYQLARQKGFPAMKIGKRIVIVVKELEEWLSKNIGKVLI